MQIDVGRSHYVTRFSGAKRKKVVTRDSFCYVPVLSTLKQIIQVKPIRDEIMSSSSNDSNLLYDISDGKVFKNHPFFKNHPKGLQIIAYYDEVETCNPLGSSSRKFKLGCVFFTLGNIRPQYRSKLKSIFLVSVAKSSTIKVNGIDSILKPFVRDLKVLHDTGITVQYAGKDEVWKGALLVFLADNLAAHELGGFKESFSFSRRFCRSCLTDKDQSQKQFREHQFVTRTTESHRDQCSRLNDPDRITVSVEYGINRISLLDSIPHFSVISGIPHDIMHDLYEGVIPHELKLLLSHCITRAFFQIHTLNHRLKAFDFGYSEIGDKPAPIEGEFKLRQSASQMWLLARIFPLLVGDLISRDDQNWLCYLKLLKICEMCNAPVLSEDSAAFLELLIEEHHQQFINLYPTASIIPKMHFMVHFPQQIINYGPLVHCWTMRHEAKLRVIKRSARVSNFKNICQTVAKRHQHLLTYYIHSSMLCTQIKIGRTKPIFMANIQESIRSLLLREYNITMETVLNTASFVTYNGITYKPNVFVLYSYDALEPIFCTISSILIYEKKVILVLMEYYTEFYDSHHHAFHISDSKTSVHLQSIENLLHPQIFHLRHTFTGNNKLYLSYKYIE